MDYIKCKKTWWFPILMSKIKDDKNTTLESFLIDLIENTKLFEVKTINYSEIIENEFSNEKFYFKLDKKENKNTLTYYVLDFTKYKELNFEIATQYSTSPFYYRQHADFTEDNETERYSRLVLCPFTTYYQINRKFVNVQTNEARELVNEGKLLILNDELVYFDYMISELNFTNKDNNNIGLDLRIGPIETFYNFVRLINQITKKNE